MPNSQASTLTFLALAVVLFFFSLTLLPAVELYCRFRRPAIVLLILELLLLVFRFRLPRDQSTSALTVATIVFAVFGIVFNGVLLVVAQGKC
jgi:hypothetical protein